MSLRYFHTKNLVQYNSILHFFKYESSKILNIYPVTLGLLFEKKISALSFTSKA